MSTLRFKIKSRRCQSSGTPLLKTQSLSSEVRSAFISSLSGSLGSLPGADSECQSLESTWAAYKAALHTACESLPVLPKGSRRRRDWVTDELRNLAAKKRDAWLRVRNAQSPQDQERRMVEYRRARKLSKDAAERARNSWWSSRAADAERMASAAERSGRGGSLIKELKLLGVSAAKASTTPLLSSDKTPLTNDVDKLQRWSEHFASLVNCCSSVSQLTLESLLIVNPLAEPHLPLPDNDVNLLCAPLSEEEISMALSQTKSGRAPGPDGVSAEILKL